MSIDIVIKQKGILKKALPLEIILGSELHYGNYDGIRLNVGELGETEFIAYNSQHIGRGFSVIWKPKEKDCITLRALTPTSGEELCDFYNCVKRITDYWKCSFEVDGELKKPSDFLSGLNEMIEFNERALISLAQNVNSDKSGPLTLFSAMWPLVIGKDEADMFIKNPASFGKWLHEKQAVDVYFAVPRFYNTDSGVLGRFALTENTPSVFPIKPYVPLGITDEIGQRLECNNYSVALCSITKDCIIGDINYERLIELIPDEKMSRFDGGNILINALSLTQMEEIIKNS